MEEIFDFGRNFLTNNRSGQYGGHRSKFRGTYVTTILEHPVLAMKTGKKSLFEKFAFLGGTLAI